MARAVPTSIQRVSRRRTGTTLLLQARPALRRAGFAAPPAVDFTVDPPYTLVSVANTRQARGSGIIVRWRPSLTPYFSEKIGQMRTTLLLVPVGAILFLGCSSAPSPPPFRPVASVKELMNSVIDPSADLIWDSVATIQTPGETEERRPHTTEEWTKVQDGATMVAESGNLLMMVPRAKDGDVWMKMAQGLTDAGVEARKAADAKDADALFNAGANIYYACSNCHVRYIDEIKNAYPNGPPDVTK